MKNSSIKVSNLKKCLRFIGVVTQLRLIKIISTFIAHLKCLIAIFCFIEFELSKKYMDETS